MMLKYIQVKLIPNLGQNISGTKHDRDKLICSTERGGQCAQDNYRTITDMYLFTASMQYRVLFTLAIMHQFP